MTRSADGRTGVLLLAVCLAAGIGAPAVAGGQAPPTGGSQPPATGATQAPAAQQAARPPSAATTPSSTTYRIGPGDSLQLFVWKEAELTREVTVRIDGKISVSLLGDVQAAGRTPAELSDDIANGLKRFLSAPVVTIAVIQPHSTRFFVLGMVGKSGEFPMPGPTSVVQAIAVAGGFREYAKTNEVMILRGQGRSSTFLRVNFDRLVSGRDSSQNVALEPGDTVLVP
jgi:polysaccharide export outer membrane protein